MPVMGEQPDGRGLPRDGAGDVERAERVRLVVDVANVMGSRPDGWWRDRAGAATRLLAELAPLAGRTVELDGAGPARLAKVAEIVAVTEGRARDASAPATGIRVVAAPADGDTTIVELAEAAAREAGHARAEASAASPRTLVVTADRGLRERLPSGVLVAGPGWLNALIGR